MKYHGVILGSDSGAPACLPAKEWLDLGGPFCHESCLKRALKVQGRGMLARPSPQSMTGAPRCWACWKPLTKRTWREKLRDWVID